MNWRFSAGVRTVLCLALAAFISGCQRDDPAASLALSADELTEAYMPVYAELKSASSQPGEHKKALFEALVERTAIADYIATQPVAADARLKLELLELRNNLLIERYLGDFLRSRVDEQAVADYYNENQDEYLDTQYRVAYLLVPIATIGASEARSRAAGLAEQFASGRTLAAVTAEYKKTYQTPVQFGELNLLKSDRARLPLVSAVGKMAVDQVSSPIQTREGVYVVKLLDRPITEPKPLHEVRAQIRLTLRQRLKEKEMQRLRAMVVGE